MALLGVNLLAWFATPSADTDFWWHLRTGRYIAETKSLPFPDPFSYTANTARDLYPGEHDTRRFNLTHEWLAQAGLYGVYAVGGIPAVILVRSLILALTAAIAGLLAWRRTQSGAWAVFGTLACGLCLLSFTADRPTLVTPFLTGVVLLIFEFGWPLWLLPLLFLIWSNLHGGFFMGGFVCAVYLLASWRQKSPQTSAIFKWCALALVTCGINPNLWSAATILGNYSRSALTAQLVEWHSPSWFAPPYAFPLLTLAVPAVLFRSWRRLRLADALLYLAFTAAAWTAFRNIPFFALIAPMLLASYWPFAWRLPNWATPATAAALAGLLTFGVASGRAVSLRAELATQPDAAIQFLLDHQVPGPVLNTYGSGGYFLWKAWPTYKSFLDGRALSETVFHDYQVLFGAYGQGATQARLRLLDQYKVQTILLQAFQPDGTLYPVIVWLNDPARSDWALLFEDQNSLVYSRSSLPGIQPLANSRLAAHLESECALLMSREDGTPACSRSAGLYLASLGDKPRALRLLGEFQKRSPIPDPDVEQAILSLRGQP